MKRAIAAIEPTIITISIQLLKEMNYVEQVTVFLNSLMN